MDQGYNTNAYNGGGFRANLLQSNGLGLHQQQRQSFQSHTSHDNVMLNCSLDPVISEEDAQLENDVPMVQIMDIDHITHQ